MKQIEFEVEGKNTEVFQNLQEDFVELHVKIPGDDYRAANEAHIATTFDRNRPHRIGRVTLQIERANVD